MHVGILGLTGYGKTTRLREHIRDELRVVAWDPVVSKEKPRGQLDMPHRFKTGLEAAKWIRKHRNPRALRCAVVGSRDPNDFAFLSQAILDSGGELVLAIDEIRYLHTGNVVQIPDPWLAFWMVEGRHYGVRVKWTGQHAGQASRTVRSQSETLEVFRTIENTDLNSMRGRFRKADFNAITTLARFEFVSSEDQ